MTIRVNGGIITDQMLKGSLEYFSIKGNFAYTVSDGNVIIPGATVEGGTPNGVNEFVVGAGIPVPGSVADHTLRCILERCTISSIKLVGTGTDGTGAAGTAEIQIAIENSSNSWHTTVSGAVDPITGIDAASDAAANMQDAIRAMGDVTVPNTSVTGTTASFAAITVSQVEFKLVS